MLLPNTIRRWYTKMNKTIGVILFYVILFMVIFGHFNPVNGTEKENMTLIPIPSQFEFTSGTFTIAPSTQILTSPGIESPLDLGRYLADCLKEDMQISLSVGELSGIPASQSIVLKLDNSSPSMGDEGYKLSIRESSIQIAAHRAAGLFYGIQSLRQIVAASDSNSLPCAEITDAPQYPWRGVLLDSARHFLEKEFILRYIDLLAYHKLNRLHLHLTDDQGWRIEIEKYPELTKTGAYRGEGETRYGGFYRQDELKEIVDYAAKRFIAVIPEVEMPGHASAAIASYPHLSCRGVPIPVETNWGIFEEVFCPGKESTFEFLERVLEEVVEIFPAEFIHIGGDEAPRARWKECAHCQQRMKDKGFEKEDELQGYLIERIARFLAGKNRRLIGWDEVLEVGGLPASTVVQSWRGMEGALNAARLGHDVISSPCQFVYFDYPQDEEQMKSKPDWMQITPLEKVYQFRPTPPELTQEEALLVKGAECTMWSEHAPQETIDAMLFPRMCAFSETIWSPANRLNWEDFLIRLQKHNERMNRLGIAYYRR